VSAATLHTRHTATADGNRQRHTKPLCTTNQKENKQVVSFTVRVRFVNTVPLYGVNYLCQNEFTGLNRVSPLCPPPPPYRPTLPHPPIPSPNPKRHRPLPLSHRCRTRHLCVNSASPMPPPPPRPPSRRRRHERGVVGRGGGGPVARHEHVVVAGPEEEADRELAPARAGVRLPRLGAQALGPTDDVPG